VPAATIGGELVRLSVQSAVCVGSGQCYRLAPSLFAPDDEGRSVPLVDEPGALDRQHAVEAWATCPSGAIELEPEPTLAERQP
jgi:ferredoxin